MDLMNIKAMVGNLPPWIILVAGAAVGWAKNFWDFIYNHTIGFMVDRMKVSITIEESDHKEAFVWVSMWMEKQLTGRRINTVRLQRKGGSEEFYEGITTNEFEFVPDYGFYYIWWKKKFVTFNSSKRDAGAGAKATPLLRTITFTIWGTRNKDLLLEVVEDSRKEFEVLREKKLKYYTQCSDWWDSHDMVNRSLDTIYLPSAQLTNIISDFEKFYASEKQYRKLGVPWRRTYLLEGPAGTGKSSLVQALSTYFKVPIYYLNIHEKLDASGLQGLLSGVVAPCIVLIEDIDSVKAAKERGDDEEKEDKKEAVLKTSDLLNAIDGLVATEKRIIIMTTNHPEKLDKALLRKGRTDRIFTIGYAQDSELEKFYDRAKEYYDIPEYSVFRNSLPESCTIADAQALVFEPKLDKI